ncbi:MAG: hemolysin family protein [Porphyromonadaceae bacterium]|nr:hemolysin family protein [Porphyromonadaceae bacterium]
MIYIYLVVSLIFSGIFSGVEIAFLSADKLRLELDRSKSDLTAKILGVFYRRPDRFITTMLLGNNVALVIYGLLVARLLEPVLTFFLYNDILVLIVQSIIGTALILFAGEFIPKVSFRINPNLALRILALPMWIVYVLLYPFVFLITLVSRGILWLLGYRKDVVGVAPSLSIVDLEHYLEMNQGPSGDKTLESEVKFIQNAITFPTLQVRDCMIPRNEIVGVEYNTPMSTLEELFVRTGFSKIIVYRENIDEVIGYIHSSEMFKTEQWQDRIVPAVFVPGSMFASKLMRQLMQRKKSIAIVIDELGGTAGMVTLEDVVEEIFGDIEDEHDQQKRVAKQLDERTYVLSGRMEIDDINERFGLQLPEDEDFMTVAGFILHHRPSIPRQGETLQIDNLSFEILRSTSTKIVLVKLTLLSEG